MSTVALVELPAAIAGHLCTSLCDRSTHALEVEAPRDPHTVDVLDMLAASAGVVLAVMEPSLTDDRYIVRWSAEAPVRVGPTLVRWLIAQGRRDEAAAAAHRLGLLDDDAFEQAWMAGTDVLAEVTG